MSAAAEGGSADGGIAEEAAAAPVAVAAPAGVVVPAGAAAPAAPVGVVAREAKISGALHPPAPAGGEPEARWHRWRLLIDRAPKSVMSLADHRRQYRDGYWTELTESSM